jgi:16S rRNA (uracil1498-N3)-methyltransferase
MRNIRLYTHSPLKVGAAVELEAGPAGHLVRVLRQRVGAEVTLFNGDGLEYAGRIIAISGRHHCQVELIDVSQPATESPLAINLVQAVGRGERMDWCIQKAVELGIDRIEPVLTERTEVRLKGDRADKRREHWQQVAIAACEQSGRVRIPDIAALKNLHEIDTARQPGYFLDPGAEAGLTRLKPPGPAGVMIVIGPEGGLSEIETNWLSQQGLTGLRLGPRVLRTETAGPAAIAILQSHFGDCQ